LMGVMNSSGRRSTGRMGGGEGPRGGGSDAREFLIGAQSGISTTHALGLNYTESLKEKLELSGNYFFNYSNNENNEITSRNYFSLDTIDQYYAENDNSDSWNYNHRLNFKAELKIDSSRSLMINPRLSYQDNESESWLLGQNFGTLQKLLNQTETSTEKDNHGYRFSNSALWRQKLNKTGRTISLMLNTELNNRDTDTYLTSTNHYFSILDSIYHYSQSTPSVSDGYTHSASLNYTEPLSLNSQLQLNITPSIIRNQTDKQNYYLDTLTHQYSLLDTSLSNIYVQKQKSYQLGMSYRLRTQKSSLMIGINFQQSRISGDQTFPYRYEVEKDYTNWLPGLMLRRRFNDQVNLTWFYRTSTNSPSVSQLQDVIDNSNPLQLSCGNPDLKQEYRHNTMLRLSLLNSDKTKSLFLILFGSLTHHYIGTMTMLSSSDTTRYQGISLPSGTQLSKPINLSDSYSLRSFLNYGRPLGFINSNLNLTGGFSYARNPGQLNLKNYHTTTTTTTLGLAMNSNISENFDFSIGYTANFNHVKKEIEESDNNDYFSHYVTGRFNLIFPGNWVFRSDLTHTLYDGLGEDYDQSYNLWNISLGKKFLPSRALELSVTFFDILGENSSISRNNSDYYVEDIRNQVIERYVMLLLSYKIQNFNRSDRG
ncbi:MAG: outer membrane beta-barrel protein, partial [Candidatus Delongbacteria bacterium]|nr:outer membrane beta-barrel protein [Candidatus Delongbacteria bacterium]